MTTTAPRPLPEMPEPSERLWEAVTGRDEPAAMRLVTAAADAGAGTEALLLDAVVGVQRRVGTAWATDRISMADEHASSAITDRVLASSPTTRIPGDCTTEEASPWYACHPPASPRPPRTS
ncbi:B12-binding domain-containing protein [Streptomyces sp. NPDC057217]|uniref:B12-binding domain-containing protein n=1 Tax=Streptomyces sp. NPDC057217 TaxID=3346054 RepID=UPI00362F5777